ncbi:MAG: hypothetical protein AB8U16_01190 [Rickettsiales endosymbiont of Dermacentor nuttalli]
MDNSFSHIRFWRQTIKNSYGLALNNYNNLYVTEYSGSRVQIFDQEHNYLNQFGNSNNNRVQVFNNDYTYNTQFGSNSSLAIIIL